MSAPESEPPAGAVIAELIGREVERTQTVAASLQSRGLAVITSAGTLVTLLFGLSALATNVEGFHLTTATKLPLSLAAGFLVLAAIAGIVTNAPRQRQVLGLDGLAPLLDDDLWTKDAKHAIRATARAQLKIATDARRANRTMARCLLAAVALEICGVACVTWAVLTLIN
jgi:hypothetical protein